MKGLQALVIIMGVIIVVGLVVVVVTIANRMSGRVEAAGAPPTTFDSVDVPIPAGCRVVETATGDGRLVLRLGDNERCNQLLVIDLPSGKHLGTVRLVPQ